MQGYEQPSSGPPGATPGNPFGDPFGDPFGEDPLNNNPLDPLNDPLDPLIPGMGQDPLITEGPFGMDSIGKLLGETEADIENRSLVPPRQGMAPGETADHLEGSTEKTPPKLWGPDELGRKLGRLEEDIETSPAEAGFIEPQIDMPQQNSPAISEKGTDDTPPLPYYLENPQQAAPFHTPPHRQGGRIGRRGGRDFKSSQPGQSDKKYCPIEDDYVSQDFCEDKDCKYYVKDSDSEIAWQCTYHDDEES